MHSANTREEIADSEEITDVSLRHDVLACQWLMSDGTRYIDSQDFRFSFFTAADDCRLDDVAGIVYATQTLKMV